MPEQLLEAEPIDLDDEQLIDEQPCEAEPFERGSPEANLLDAEPIDVEPVELHRIVVPVPQAPGPGRKRSPKAAPSAPPRRARTGKKDQKQPPRGAPAEQPPPGGAASTKPSRPLRKRPRVLLVAAGLLVAGTMILSLWSNARARLPSELLQHADEGTKAFEKGDFTTAKEQLAAAVGIVGRLEWPGSWFGRPNQRVLEFQAERRRNGHLPVVQLYREAAVCDELLETSMQHLAEEAVKEFHGAGLQSWNRSFARHYQGRAIILDATVTPRDDGTGRGFAVHYVLQAGEARFEFEPAGLAVFTQMKWDGPRRVVFGARLAAVEPAGDDAKQWRIRLQPESGVLISRPSTLQHLGWPVDHPLGTQRDPTVVLQQQLEEMRAWQAQQG